MTDRERIAQLEEALLEIRDSSYLAWQNRKIAEDALEGITPDTRQASLVGVVAKEMELALERDHSKPGFEALIGRWLNLLTGRAK